MSQTALLHLWKNSKLIPNETFYILICNALRREIILCWKTYCNTQIHVSCGSAPISHLRPNLPLMLKTLLNLRRQFFQKNLTDEGWELLSKGLGVWYDITEIKNHHFSNKVLNAVEVHVIINNKTKFISIYILLSNFYVHQNAFP